MFTGITQATPPVRSASKKGGILRVRVATPRGWKLRIGQSVAIDGICSTVVSKTPKYFEVEYMRETLRKTTAANFKKNTLVNLEKPMKFGDSLGGHLLEGHVDARVRVARMRRGVLVLLLPTTLARRAPPHGSIAINGVSLTIARRLDDEVIVALIPYTLAHTNLGALKQGDWTNVEVARIYDRVSGNAKKRI